MLRSGFWHFGTSGRVNAGASRSLSETRKNNENGIHDSGSLVVPISAWTNLSADDFSQLQQQFHSHCINCHGMDGAIEADVNLLSLNGVEDLEGKPELLEKLIRVLQDHEMPPEDEPQPTDAERNGDDDATAQHACGITSGIPV